MNYNQITVGIVTFKSENVIFNCLKSIKKIKNIIIFDNSNDKELEIKIKKKYPKIKFFLSKKNLGYGVANNQIIKKSKTPYIFILSPDVILKKNCEQNLLKSAKKIKDFSILAPISQYKHYDLYKEDLSEAEGVQGFAMLINKKKIIQIGMFDKNIFLYAEEKDLCRRLRLNQQKIYIDKKAKVFHLSAKSSNIGFEFDKCRNWHFMWSQVYYDKKYFNTMIVYIKFILLLFPQLLKIIFYAISFNKNEVINKFMRFSGTINSLLGKKSWYRPKFKSY